MKLLRRAPGGYHQTIVLRGLGMALAVACALTMGMDEDGVAEPVGSAAVCSSSWSTVASAPEVSSPRAIAPISPDDIWIVGDKGLVNGVVSTGAEHWDGTNWTLFPTPNKTAGANAENVLAGTDAVSSNDVWAVGYSGPGLYKTLVEHWDGTRWSIVPSPNVGSQTNSLLSVDALGPNVAWAVGYRMEDAKRKTLVQVWNGTSWSIVSTPNPGSLSNTLLGVAAVAADDVWAVGYKSSGRGYRSLVLHYDGETWSEVTVPVVGTGDNVITSIAAVDGRNIWATGYYINGAQYRTLALRYDGATWRYVPSANPGNAVTVLRSVGAYSPTDAWAVGFEYRAGLNNFVASTQHWNGSAWTAVPSAIAKTNARSEFLDVARASGTSQLWAAGAFRNVETICPDTTTAAPAADGASVPDAALVRAATTDASTEQVAAAPSGIPVTAVDKSSDAGISEVTRTRGAVVADYNNDGSPDIFLNRHQLVPRFYVNDGNGRFTQTNKDIFVHVDRHGCDEADVNNDRLLDIFCTVGAARGTQLKRNDLYIQQPDNTFIQQGAQYGVLEPFSRGRSAAFIDANGDAYIDLFTANEENRGDGLPSPNRLFINQGGNAYSYGPRFGLEHEVGDGDPRGGDADVGDLDKDGWEDLVVETISGLRVYHNNQGNGFTNVAASVGLGQKPRDTVLADVDGDSWLDVIEVASKELRVLRNTNGTFSTVFSTPLDSGLAIAAGDVNGDDRVDIYVMRDNSSVNAPDQVYLNDGTGTSFSLMSPIPSTSQGRAESVWPIDYDGNGLTDFLVLNGKRPSGGPLQLIAFFPAP